jgi:hypothetical protein
MLKDEIFRIINMHEIKINDLVKGDIIKIAIKGFDDFVLIYDGCNFIKVDPFPRQFNVLNRGVPFDYWTDRNDKLIEGIERINVNIEPFREQILDHLSWNEGVGYTSYFDGREIIFGSNDIDRIIEKIENSSALVVSYSNKYLMKTY